MKEQPVVQLRISPSDEAYIEYYEKLARYRQEIFARFGIPTNVLMSVKPRSTSDELRQG